jgi:hypothetical protein
MALALSEEMRRQTDIFISGEPEESASNAEDPVHQTPVNIVAMPAHNREAMTSVSLI